MKRIYIILEAQASNWNGFNISQVAFVFTSKKAAMKQMDDIKKCVESGQWWRDKDWKPLKCEVISDKVMDGSYMYDFQRDLHVKSPNGIDVIYRLIGYDKVNSNFEYRDE